MFKVGLTGGIACGKSIVAAMLVRKGALLLDADQLAREVVAPGEPAWQAIKNWLDESYFHEDGTLDRGRIAGLVFTSVQARDELNKIVHPRVIDLLWQRSSVLEQENEGRVQVWDVPLLFEAGLTQAVDLVLVVSARQDVQVRRLAERDGLGRAQALRRIRAQMPLAAKIKSADYVIHNNGTLIELSGQVDCFWRVIMDRMLQSGNLSR